MISRRVRTVVFWFTLAGAVALLLLPLMLLGAEPDQAGRWAAARLRPEKSIALDKAVFLYQRTAGRYQALGVPPVVVFALHYREADNSFSCSLAQGDSLLHRSVHVPRGRIPGIAPPYTWEQCARDALALDHMPAKNWSGVQPALWAIEGYNGTGYARMGVPSPYLWAGTTIYSRGKYVSDGRYSATAVDAQLGCAAILLRLRERGLTLPFR